MKYIVSIKVYSDRANNTVVISVNEFIILEDYPELTPSMELKSKGCVKDP